MDYEQKRQNSKEGRELKLKGKPTRSKSKLEQYVKNYVTKEGRKMKEDRR
jgi:hypothetical protein